MYPVLYDHNCGESQIHYLRFHVLVAEVPVYLVEPHAGG